MTNEKLINPMSLFILFTNADLNYSLRSFWPVSAAHYFTKVTSRKNELARVMCIG